MSLLNYQFSEYYRPQEPIAYPGWYKQFDYPGGHAICLATHAHFAEYEAQTGIWRSRLALSLKRESTIVGHNALVHVKYIEASYAVIPFPYAIVRCYKDEEEAEKGHKAMIAYLEQFMLVRRLFDDVVAAKLVQRNELMKPWILNH